MTIWMVRTGKPPGRLFDLYRQKGMVAIGWPGVGSLLDAKDNPEALRQRVRETHPSHSQDKVTTEATQIRSFRFSIEANHRVATYNPNPRARAGEMYRHYLVGTCGPYQYARTGDYPTADLYPHYRRVKWQRTPVSRDLLSRPTQNALGVPLTVFKIRDSAEQEIVGKSRPLGSRRLTCVPDARFDEIGDLRVPPTRFVC